MKNSSFLVWCGLVAVVTGAQPGRAQVGGNSNYDGDSSLVARQNERSKRNPTPQELRPDNTSTFVDAGVLMNVKADEYVAVFGLAQMGDSVSDATTKMEATLTAFKASLNALGVKNDDIFVDFVAQTKIYGYRVDGTLAKEQLVGFELKKNVLIHYKDKALIDQLTLAASRAQIYDLVKVDYIVKDTASIQDKLKQEAARIIRHKVEQNQALFGLKLVGPTQVIAEKPSIYYPTEMYDSYTAFESETMRAEPDKYTVQDARKGRTIYFNPLDADGFDTVINPVVTEPVVQFTYYLKLRFENANAPTPTPK